MSATRVDERSQRAARARAVAATITDSPRVPRRFHVSDDIVLRPSGRRRITRPRPRISLPDVFRATRSRRRAALVIVLAQLALLGALFVLPVFRASNIDISGARLMSRDAILGAAGISTSQSIFTIDGQSVRNRLEHLPWVRSATVETELPGTVRISITEWTPILRVSDSRGNRIIAPGGESLDVSATDRAAVASLPVLIDKRPLLAGAPSPPLDPTLMRTLAAVAATYPQSFAIKVSRFEWQSDGRLAIVAASGWRAILGDAGNDAEIAAIPGQLNALAAVKARISFTKPNFGYVDLANPAAPVVGGAPETVG